MPAVVLRRLPFAAAQAALGAAAGQVVKVDGALAAAHRAEARRGPHSELAASDVGVWQAEAVVADRAPYSFMIHLDALVGLAADGHETDRLGT